MAPHAVEAREQSVGGRPDGPYPLDAAEPCEPWPAPGAQPHERVETRVRPSIIVDEAHGAESGSRDELDGTDETLCVSTRSSAAAAVRVDLELRHERFPLVLLVMMVGVWLASPARIRARWLLRARAAC